MGAYYNEIDPFCCEVLKARIADGRLPEGQVDGRDVREVRPDEIPAGQVHLFAGIGGFAYAARLAGLPDDFNIWTAGFPCQDISTAGKGAGLHGSRSGLFFEIVRLLRGVERRPAWVLLENVPALRTRGADRVLAEMEAVGYSVRPFVVGAWAVGAPHKRDRAWIVCQMVNPAVERLGRGGEDGPRESAGVLGAGLESDGGLADAARPGQRGQSATERPDRERVGAGGDEGLADTGCEHGRTRGKVAGEHETAGGNPSCSADPERPRAVADTNRTCRWPSHPGEPQHEWEAARLTQFRVGQPTPGIPERLVQHIRAITGWDDARAEAWWRKNRVRIWRKQNREGLKAMGNSIVPQVAAEVMRAIMGMSE